MSQNRQTGVSTNEMGEIVEDGAHCPTHPVPMVALMFKVEDQVVQEFRRGETMVLTLVVDRQVDGQVIQDYRKGRTAASTLAAGQTAEDPVERVRAGIEHQSSHEDPTNTYHTPPTHHIATEVFFETAVAWEVVGRVELLSNLAVVVPLWLEIRMVDTLLSMEASMLLVIGDSALLVMGDSTLQVTEHICRRCIKQSSHSREEGRAMMQEIMHLTLSRRPDLDPLVRSTSARSRDSLTASSIYNYTIQMQYTQQKIMLS